MRKKKITAIGTMLEKSTISNPYKGINFENPLPKVLVNDKIFGKNTDQSKNLHKDNMENNMFANDNFKAVGFLEDDQ